MKTYSDYSALVLREIKQVFGAALTEALRGPKPLTDPALREAVAMDQAALLTAIQELEG